MSEVPELAQRLEIERACERLLYEYMRAIDRSDPDGAADLFAKDGSLARPLAPDQIIQGQEAIRASLRQRPPQLVTRHLVGNVLIDVESPVAATGVSSVVMIATHLPPDGQLPNEAPGPMYFGEFRDRFVRIEDRWCFLERRGSIQIKY